MKVITYDDDDDIIIIIVVVVIIIIIIKRQLKANTSTTLQIKQETANSCYRQPLKLINTQNKDH
jgi:hypothetical protein